MASPEVTSSYRSHSEVSESHIYATQTRRASERAERAAAEVQSAADAAIARAEEATAVINHCLAPILTKEDLKRRQQVLSQSPTHSTPRFCLLQSLILLFEDTRSEASKILIHKLFIVGFLKIFIGNGTYTTHWKSIRYLLIHLFEKEVDDTKKKVEALRIFRLYTCCN